MTIPDLLSPATADAFTSDLLTKIGEAAPDFIYAKDRQSRMVFANQAVLSALGKTWEDIRGRSDDEWHDDPEEGRKFVEADARIMASGLSEELEERLTGVHGTQIFLSTKTPLRAPDGTVIGIFGISKDITQRKREEYLRQILLNELDHRVKNTLSLVQVMARQTFKTVGIDKAIWNAFDGRLIAMSKAHGLLTRQSWVGADIAEVVREALVAHGGGQSGQFEIAGGPAWIDAQTALALAMALHELGTNAIKYGALSVPEGRVAIAWEVEQDAPAPANADPAAPCGPGLLNLRWSERDGPAVTAPTGAGFGSRMIRQAFAPIARRGPEVDYHPDGVAFTVCLPLSVPLAQ